MWLRSAAAWLVIVTSYFAIQAAAASFSHAYDKIWMYYAYNLAWKLEGPSQKYILRFLDLTNPDDRRLNNQNINNGNRGSLPNGQLNWDEFQHALNWVTRSEPGPALSDDFDALAREIWRTSWMQSEVKLGRAQSFNIYPRQTPPAGYVGYSEYMHKLADMVDTARTRLNDPGIAADLEKLHTLGGKILQIRALEFRQSRYVGDDLKNVFPGINIVEYEVPNPDPRFENTPSKNFKVVDTRKTLQKPESQAAIKTALGMEGDTTEQWKWKFMDRVNGYGMEVWGRDKVHPPYGQQAVAHGKAISAWHRAFVVSLPQNC